MKSDFLIALTQLAAERNLPRNTVISAIELALAAAYKKDNFDPNQNISVTMDPGSGDVTVFILKLVVATVEDDLIEISLDEAKTITPSAEIDDTIKIDSHLYTAGRIAAQTAKQVVMQKLREAERDLIFEEYAEKFDNIVTGSINKMEQGGITVDLGRTEAHMPDREKVVTERYRINQKLKFYIVEVNKGTRNPEIIVSRAHKELLRKLFEIEIPEISNKIVEIKAIAREPGSRSKVAVWTEQEGVDAVGSCVGLRGIRIQNIVNELQGEKIDIVQWNADPKILHKF
jgi:N utilization substance protein A